MPPFAFGVTHGFIPAFLANFLFLRRFVWVPFISCINTVGSKVMTSNFKLLLFVIILIFYSLFASAAFAAPSHESLDERGSCGEGWTEGGRWEKKSTSQIMLGTVENWECGADAPWGWSLYKNSNQFVCVTTAKLQSRSCVCDTASGAYYDEPSNSCACPSAQGLEMNPWIKQCVPKCPSGSIRTDPMGACSGVPTICNSPKTEVNGACVCPSGTFASGEKCISMPDCSSKQAECSSSCASQDKAVSRFYCESSIASDPSTQLFSGQTYKCECTSTAGCPSGQMEVISTSGLKSCRASSGSGCPTGSYYGEYQGKTGCIEPSSSSDPNSPPENCISGSSPVYHGSTLYCVPPPNSDKDATGNDAGCPAGTSPVLSSGTYICKGADGTGRTQGSGGSGSNSGSGIGSSDAAIAATGAVEQQLKENAKADEKANAENNKELKDINSKLFAANQTLQEIKDKIPEEIKSEEESPINSPETLKTALDAAIDRLADAPIISAALDVLGQFPDSQGSCPVIAFSFWGRDISSDLHCQLFEDVKPNLEAVMLAFWSIFAVFVFRRMG